MVCDSTGTPAARHGVDTHVHPRCLACVSRSQTLGSGETRLFGTVQIDTRTRKLCVVNTSTGSVTPVSSTLTFNPLGAWAFERIAHFAERLCVEWFYLATLGDRRDVW